MLPTNPKLPTSFVFLPADFSFDNSDIVNKLKTDVDALHYVFLLSSHLGDRMGGFEVFVPEVGKLRDGNLDKLEGGMWL